MRSNSLPTSAVVVLLCINLIALVFFLLTLQKMLRKCGPDSRTMEPGTVWLWLIPVFGTVWQFIVVINIAKSLTSEFVRLGIPNSELTTNQAIGLGMCVCNCCIFLPVLGGFAAIVGLVLWIVYWLRIANYSRLLDACQLTSSALPTA